MTNTYPHSSHNSAARRAALHSNTRVTVTVDTLTRYCPVEIGRDYCPVCCAVVTDTPVN